jgi:hypothetical protein
MPFFAPGPIEMFMFLGMTGLFSGGGLMGLPPAERDVVLAQCAPAESIFYAEWSERSSGKPGAKGIDGFAGDPEIRTFIKDLEAAILKTVKKETENSNDPIERAMAKAVPPIVKILLNRPGCLYGDFDGKVLGNAEQGPVRWMAALAGVKATLVINGGKDANALAGHIAGMLELLPAELRKKNLDRQPIPLPVPGGGILILHRHQNYFILGFGKGAIDQAIAGLTGKSKGLLGNERFVAASKKVAFKRTANIAWIDVKTVVKHAGTIFGPQVQAMVKMVGADSIGHVMTSTGVVDGEIRTKSFVSTGGKTDGLLSLVSGRAIKPADLAHVPADSDLVFSFSVNAPKMLTAVKKIVAAADLNSKAALDGLLKQFEEELGLSLENDLFKAFGDVWVIHDSKSAGGLFLTSMVASLEVRDPQKAEDVFSKLMDLLEESLPGVRKTRFRRRGVELKKKLFMGNTIYYINTVGDEVPFAPAFCLTNKHLLAAPHPQALKAHLRFLSSKQPNFTTLLKKENTFPEGDLICFSFCESKRMLRTAYAFAPYFGQFIASFAQSQGLDIDIFSLPSARAVLPYFGNSVSSIARTKDGIFSESRNSSPALSGGLPMLVIPYFFLAVSSVQEFEEIGPPKAAEKKLNRLNPKQSLSAVAFARYLRSIFANRSATTARTKAKTNSVPLRRSPEVKRSTGA